MKHVVFFATIYDTDDGIFVDFLYFGGITECKEDAEHIARRLTNDKNLPGAIVPKIFPLEDDTKFPLMHKIATKHFHKLANDMYDAEEARQRK